MVFTIMFPVIVVRMITPAITAANMSHIIFRVSFTLSTSALFLELYKTGSVDPRTGWA